MNSIHSYSQIQEIITIIRSHKKGFITNFYLVEERCDMFINKKLLFFVKMPKCALILRRDRDFYHVYYIATDKMVLAEMLKILTENYPNNIFISDIVGVKSIVNDISSTYALLGFEKYNQLYRMSRTKNLDEPQPLDQKVEFANLEHTGQIQYLLEKYFDPYCEQLPQIEEIQKWIETKNIIVVVEEENVIGFVIFEINGIMSYLRYWFTHPNHRGKKLGSALLKRFFHECRATKRQLFWVIESNENAIVRYKHYGFEQEQLFDQVMIKKIDL